MIQDAVKGMVKNMGDDQTKDLILKFDIEGAEWEALEDVPPLVANIDAVIRECIGQLQTEVLK